MKKLFILVTILLSGCASNLPYYAADIAVQYGQRNTVQSLGSFVTEQQILNSIRQ